METKNLLLIGIALFVGYSAQFTPKVEPEIRPVAAVFSDEQYPVLTISQTFSQEEVRDPKVTASLQANAKERVRAEFKKIESKEDRILIHKLFSGASDYLKNCKSLSQTGQFDPILGRVQNSYGWEREKYPKFTDEVSNYLKAVGFETPKMLDNEESRKEFQKIFEGLAEATHE
jgi:hypothetical protein